MKLDYAARNRLERIGATVGSLALHVLLVALLVRFAVYQAPPPVPPPDTDIVWAPDALVVPPSIEPPPAIDPTAWDRRDDEPVMPALEPAQAPVVDGGETSADAGTDLPRFDLTDSLVHLDLAPGNMGPRTPAGRRIALDQYGLPPAVSTSVVMALEWLKDHQEADGAWAGEDRAAMGGLAVLTFLAHGETTGSDRYGPTVERALQHLLRAQGDHGRFSDNVYAHAIATYAMSEAWGLCRIPPLHDAMARGVQVILDGQQPGGGWDYRYDKKARRDTSVAGWQIQALKAARIAGAENPGLAEGLARAVEDLQSAQDGKSGRFAYAEPGAGGSDAVTGVGALCLQLLGRRADRSAARGMDALAGLDCDWKDAPAWALYTWYYVTQANFHYSKGTWNRWKDKFARTLLRHQNPDGSWTPPGNEAKYGPVYGTTLAALTLQVYARTLPTYKALAVRDESAPARQDDEVQVRVL